MPYANDIHTKLWFISAGFGVAPTIATFAQVKRPGLVFRPLTPHLPPVQTVLVCRRSDDSPALANFLAGYKGDSLPNAAGCVAEERRSLPLKFPVVICCNVDVGA